MAPAIRGEAAVAKARSVVRAMVDKAPRPFSCALVWEDSKKVVSKAVMQACLTAMTAEGALTTKTVGKGSVIYFPPQLATMTTEEMYSLQSETLPTLTNEARSTAGEAARIEARARAVAAQPTNVELEEAAQSDLDTSAVEARVKVLQSREFVPANRLSAAEAERAKELRRWRELRRCVSAVVEDLRDRCDDRCDVAHLAGIVDDFEVGAGSPTRVVVG